MGPHTEQVQEFAVLTMAGSFVQELFRIQSFPDAGSADLMERGGAGAGHN